MKLTAAHLVEVEFVVELLGVSLGTLRVHEAQASMQSSKLPTNKPMRGGFGALALHQIVNLALPKTAVHKINRGLFLYVFYCFFGVEIVPNRLTG